MPVALLRESVVRTRLTRIVRTQWSDVVTGLVLYRCERFSEAKARLKMGLEREPEWRYRTYLWLALAMAEARLGQHEDARSWYDRAERWIAEQALDRPGGIERGVPDGWTWSDAVALHLLRREACALLGRDFDRVPENVFAEPRPISQDSAR